MNKFLMVLGVVKTIISFGNKLFVFIDPCKCGSRNVKLYRLEHGWCVYCVDCHIKGTEYKLRRQAKRAWNKDMKEIKKPIIPSYTERVEIAEHPYEGDE